MDSGGSHTESQPLWWQLRALLDAAASVLIFLGMMSLFNIELKPRGLVFFAAATLVWRLAWGYRRRHQ